MHMKRFIANLRVPTHQKFKKFFYIDVLIALIREVFTIDFTTKKISTRKRGIKSIQNLNEADSDMENFEEM
jgi:hypothetical protein